MSETAPANLKLIRQFSLMNQHRIGQTPSGQSAPSEAVQSSLSTRFSLGWSLYVFLMSISNPEERAFYEIEAAANDWSVRELNRQFNASLYERLALSRDKEKQK